MRTYYGLTFDEAHKARDIFATVTGQMEDGTLVYTEIEQCRGAIVSDEKGNPKLILDNQFTRHLKYGTQTFTRL